MREVILKMIWNLIWQAVKIVLVNNLYKSIKEIKVKNGFGKKIVQNI